MNLNRKILLSTLWIFAVLNYLYADVFSLMNPTRLKEFMNGVVGEMTITPFFFVYGWNFNGNRNSDGFVFKNFEVQIE